MKNIYGITYNELENYFININDKKYRATQLYEFLYKKKITDLTQKLAAAQPPKLGGKPGGDEDPQAAAPTPEQATAIAEFQNQLLAARQELRNVRFDLRKDIRRLETWVEFVNIALMPVLVALFALGLGLARHRRRTTARG